MSLLDESLINTLPPFSRLDPGQVRAILAQSQSRRYGAGAAVFHEGDIADRFFLLLDGYIRVVKTTPEGDQIVPLHIPPGQLFGIAPALSRSTYPASAMTASESLVLQWPARLWEKFVADYDGFATETYRTLGGRLEEMQTRIAELATQAVEQRVAAALLRMVNQSGRKVEDGIEIDFPITRQNIAEMTGTTLHTVSRLLSAWEKDGLVRSERRRIVVTAPHRLVLLSSGT